MLPAHPAGSRVLRKIRPVPALVYLLLHVAAFAVAMGLVAVWGKGKTRNNMRIATNEAKTLVFGLAGGLRVWAQRRWALRGAEPV
jgi:hypothetical protein